MAAANEPTRVLAIHAHPDDVEFQCAGTLALLAQRGCVVYLITSVEQQAHRVSHARHRPLLTNVDPEAKLRQLMSEREPLYCSVADLKVTTDGRKIQAVAEEIIKALGFPVAGG